MAVQIQLRRDTAANWTASDPTLAAGEFGFETDTYKFKLGDGATAWTALAYYQDGLPAGGGSGLGIMGWDEGIPVGTGTILNLVGDRGVLSLSGTVLNLLLSPDPEELIGFYGQDEGGNLGTGTILNVVGDGATLTLSGSVFDLSIPGGAGGVDQIGVYGQDSGVPLGTGTIINFDDNLTATLSGTVLNIDAAAGSAFPEGHLFGLVMSNNATDATNDIDIAGGEARDDSDSEDIVLPGILTKQLDAAWAVGSGTGGLDTGSIADDTYHIWVIKRSDTGVVDALFSTSPTSPTMPANYDYKRLIGSIVRDSAAIVLFTQRGDEFLLSTPYQESLITNPGVSATLNTLTKFPTDRQFNALLYIGFADNTPAGNTYYLVTSPDQADTVPSVSIFNVFTTVAITSAYAALNVRTNTSAQIRMRQDVSSADHKNRINVFGWIDSRGKME